MKHTLGCEINTLVRGHHKYCECPCHEIEMGFKRDLNRLYSPEEIEVMDTETISEMKKTWMIKHGYEV